MNDVSATGLSLLIQASQTFPSGILVTAFADDAEPLDLPAVDIAQTGMDINGNLVCWSTPTPQTVTTNVLPGSEEDKNLAILLEVNTAKRGRRQVDDRIRLVASYGDGATTTARNGKMTNGSREHSAASGGRLKSKAYTSVFQDFDSTRIR